MSAQPAVCHLPHCSELVSITLPRKLSEFSYALCLQHGTLEPGTEQDRYLCTRHYNSMYTNPARLWRQQESSNTASLTVSRKRTRTSFTSSLDDDGHRKAPAQLDEGKLNFSSL